MVISKVTTRKATYNPVPTTLLTLMILQAGLVQADTAEPFQQLPGESSEMDCATDDLSSSGCGRCPKLNTPKTYPRFQP